MEVPRPAGPFSHGKTGNRWGVNRMEIDPGTIEREVGTMPDARQRISAPDPLFEKQSGDAESDKRNDEATKVSGKRKRAEGPEKAEPPAPNQNNFFKFKRLLIKIKTVEEELEIIDTSRPTKIQKEDRETIWEIADEIEDLSNRWKEKERIWNRSKGDRRVEVHQELSNDAGSELGSLENVYKTMLGILARSQGHEEQAPEKQEIIAMDEGILNIPDLSPEIDSQDPLLKQLCLEIEAFNDEVKRLNEKVQSLDDAISPLTSEKVNPTKSNSERKSLDELGKQKTTLERLKQELLEEKEKSEKLDKEGKLLSDKIEEMRKQINEAPQQIRESLKKEIEQWRKIFLRSGNDLVKVRNKVSMLRGKVTYAIVRFDGILAKGN